MNAAGLAISILAVPSGLFHFLVVFGSDYFSSQPLYEERLVLPELLVLPIIIGVALFNIGVGIAVSTANRSMCIRGAIVNSAYVAFWVWYRDVEYVYLVLVPAVAALVCLLQIDRTRT